MKMMQAITEVSLAKVLCVRDQGMSGHCIRTIDSAIDTLKQVNALPHAAAAIFDKAKLLANMDDLPSARQAATEALEIYHQLDTPAAEENVRGFLESINS